MLQRKQWRDLTPRERAAIMLLGTLQFLLLGAAQLDIRRRAEHEIRGSKSLWTALTLVNFAGPIAYFLYGRKR